jgi:3alpha(or 20beta)-hydroxysteroid dehydrogenase
VSRRSAASVKSSAPKARHRAPRNDPFRLEGKAALVTGAARGIGAAIAAALAAQGAGVLVTDLRETEGQQTARRIRAGGGQASFLRLDVTDEEQWEATVAAAVRELGGLDILVNNAGIESAALLTQCTAAEFRRVMEVNVLGVFLGVKHAVRAMAPGGSAGRGGTIINLSSVAGLVGSPGHIAYHTSKGAVRLLTKAAAIECAQLGFGIRVNSIHPAIVDTAMGSDFIRHLVELKLAPDYETAVRTFQTAHPLNRFGRPEEIAAAAVYLASDAAQWITGSELVLDGGYTAA